MVSVRLFCLQHFWLDFIDMLYNTVSHDIEKRISKYYNWHCNSKVPVYMSGNCC